MIGATISHYRILGKLGEGGMGVVYKAMDLRLERPVALKLVSKEITNGRFRTGLLREAKLAASLSHPNIAHVYEAGEAEGEWYIAMEFVEGQTLRQRMASGASLRELAGYLSQVSDALQHAHLRGVIHCDLKPENIILTADGLAKVLDFGLARLVRANRSERVQSLAQDVKTRTVTALSSSDFIQGTIGYMSPEQADGQAQLTASTDIFSFGCIVFEAVARQVPFSDPSPISALHKLLYNPAPRLEELVEDVPAEVQHLIDVCLEKEPANQASSFAEIGEDLRQFLRATRPVQAVAPKKIGGGPSAAKRSYRRTRFLSGALILLLVITALLLYVRGLHSDGQPGGNGIGSLAVLPFENTSATREIDFLSEGLSEGLINALAQLPNLKVVARTSSFQFKADRRDPQQIARRLGVRTLLSGRLYQSEGGLRVSVELLNGGDGAVLWAHTYAPGGKDLTTVEDQMVPEIARRIAGPRKPVQELPLTESSRVIPEAYSLFLRGRYEMRLYNPQSTQTAVDYYREALAIDPGFALANAELANSYRLLSGAGILSPSEAMPLAEAAALRAIGRDERLGQAHAVLADIRRDQWNWRAAEQEYTRALQLNPNLVSAHTGLAIYLSLIGKVDQAIQEALKARDLDPLGVPTSINVGAVYYNCRKYDDALRELERSTALDPSASALWTWIGIVNGGAGRYSQAIEAYQKAIRLGDRTAATLCAYAYSLAKSGRRREAETILKQLQSSRDYLPPTALAILFIGLDQKERTLQLLEQAFTSRDQLVQYIGVESHFDIIQANPRFQSIIAKLGLPVSRKQALP